MESCGLRKTVFRQAAWLALRTAFCAAIALGLAAAARSQTSPAEAAEQAKLVTEIEAQAQAYQGTIANVPLEVQETIRDYDSTGHLKRTRKSSYRYTFDAGGGDTNQGASGKAKDAAILLPGANLADGVTLPFVFLPGSIAHLSLHAETASDGPQVLRFKSAPCSPPDMRHRWMGADIESQCVEGNAFVDPSDGSLTRIRMNMGGLPVFFRSWPLPTQVEVYQLYNDATFRLLPAAAGQKAQLVPIKSEYVLFTSRGRTVIDRVFQVIGSNHS